MASSSKTKLDAIEKIYRDLFCTASSLSRIRDAAISDRLFARSLGGLDVPGRSIAWKLFLLPSSEPLKAPAEADASFILDTLKCSRKQYTKLVLENMRAPDGGYEEGFMLPGSTQSPKRVSRPDSNLQRNNPLSLDTKNPWKEWFTSVDLRKTILQDVERTFPEVDFFRLPDVQSELISILFVYSVTNPSVGYRQGMHELLAPVYHAVYNDAIGDNEALYTQDCTLKEICSKPWIAADAWKLFDSIMHSAARWYEWQEPAIHTSANSPLGSHVHLNVTQGEGRVELKPYVTPIVQTCSNIQANLLRTTDPQLWHHLQSTGIEPQIYGIRWLRLLFTREFGLSDAMKLWDALFACDVSLDLAPWICVTMLIRIRNELIPADYTGQLTVLLRYPAPQRSHEYDAPKNHTSLLVRQALALQMSPTPATGVTLVAENWNLLNIPMEVPAPPPAPIRRDHPSSTRGRPVSTSAWQSSSSQPGFGHIRQTSQQIGFTEMLGGILERGEGLSINKSLMNAVNELKRNIPEIASSLIKPPTSAASPAFSLESDRPPWEPRSRIDMEREIAQYRSVNKKLGDSLSWIVDVLLQDEGDDSALLKKKRTEAVESLAYVRDVLISEVKDVEEDRLYGEEEHKRRRMVDEKESRTPQLEVVGPSVPTPVSVAPESRPRPATFGPSSSARRAPRALDISNISNMTSPIRPAPRVNAPWNHTRSNFTSPSNSHHALPRSPPPVSITTTLKPTPANHTESKPTVRSQAPVLQDPLGALQ